MDSLLNYLPKNCSERVLAALSGDELQAAYDHALEQFTLTL